MAALTATRAASPPPTASAARAARVPLRSPAPGVSTSWMPVRSSQGCGQSTCTVPGRTSLPSTAVSSSHDSGASSSRSRFPSGCRRQRAGVGPCRTWVRRAVVGKSPTGRRSAPSSRLISVLLPRENSPATATEKVGSFRRTNSRCHSGRGAFSPASVIRCRRRVISRGRSPRASPSAEVFSMAVPRQESCQTAAPWCFLLARRASEGAANPLGVKLAVRSPGGAV
jgi:hypothetical protein